MSQAALAVSGGNGNSKSQNSQNSERRNSQDGEKRPVVSFPPLKGDVVIREKCRDMLQNSLKCDDKPGMLDALTEQALLVQQIYRYMQSINTVALKMVKVSKLVQRKLIPYRSALQLGVFRKI